MSRTLDDVRWQESSADLYMRYRSVQNVNARKRLQALWLVQCGTPVQEAADQAGVGRRTLKRWLAWYRTGGLAEVLRRLPGHGAQGVVGWLSPEQREALVTQCSAGAFQTYGEARAWVEHEYGITYGYQGMYTVLARMDVHPKVPRPTAAKADPQVQEAWKKRGSARR